MNVAALVSFLCVSIVFFLVATVRPRQGFYVVRGAYGPWVSALSIVAAFTGGGAILNTTGLAEQYGLWALSDVFPAVLGLSLSAVFVWARFFGRDFSTRFFTVDVKTYDRLGVSVHFFEVGFLYILVIAAQFRGVALLSEAVGVSSTIGIAATAAFVAAYSFRGFSAVTRTDFVQLVFMIPLYFVVLLQAAEPISGAVSTAAVTQVQMPITLVLALALPALFLPISQEIHQRAASARDDKAVGRSYIIAAAVYLVLGGILVTSVAVTPGLTIPGLLDNRNTFVVAAVAVGIFSALLSSMDTSVNISAHALQKLPRLSSAPGPLVQIGVLASAFIVFLFFPTILSLILLALFVYMAGPALTFVAIYLGVHPRRAAGVSILFCALHSFVHLRLAALDWTQVPQWAETILGDKNLTSMLLVGLQVLVLLVLFLKRKLG